MACATVPFRGQGAQIEAHDFWLRRQAGLQAGRELKHTPALSIIVHTCQQTGLWVDCMADALVMAHFWSPEPLVPSAEGLSGPAQDAQLLDSLSGGSELPLKGQPTTGALVPRFLGIQRGFLRELLQ